jgi:ketosteroid isomerase-like protein
MTANQDRLLRLAENFLGSWNTQDVEKVVSCYTDDLVYVDPNTRGPVEGADAMRRYLRKLFDRWRMSWHLRELFPLEGCDGSAVLWRATLGLGDKSVEALGMDLVIMRGDLIERNEVYFDRSILTSLFEQ